MEAGVFIKSLIIGFALAVPIGPLGALCVCTTLNEGRHKGLIVGLGAATVDALYGSVAAFGLAYVPEAIDSNRLWVRLAGGFILLVLGIHTLKARQSTPAGSFVNKGWWRIYASTVLIALTNPLTIVVFAAVFTALDISRSPDTLTAWMAVSGVFAGSGLWFVTLGHVAGRFQRSFTADGLRRVNQTAGLLIILSGIVSLMSAV